MSTAIGLLRRCDTRARSRLKSSSQWLPEGAAAATARMGARPRRRIGGFIKLHNCSHLLKHPDAWFFQDLVCPYAASIGIKDTIPVFNWAHMIQVSQGLCHVHDYCTCLIQYVLDGLQNGRIWQLCWVPPCLNRRAWTGRASLLPTWRAGQRITEINDHLGFLTLHNICYMTYVI